jgi:hypothetical protein
MEWSHLLNNNRKYVIRDGRLHAAQEGVGVEKGAP